MYTVIGMSSLFHTLGVGIIYQFFLLVFLCYFASCGLFYLPIVKSVEKVYPTIYMSTLLLEMVAGTFGNVPQQEF